MSDPKKIFDDLADADLSSLVDDLDGDEGGGLFGGLEPAGDADKTPIPEAAPSQGGAMYRPPTPKQPQAKPAVGVPADLFAPGEHDESTVVGKVPAELEALRAQARRDAPTPPQPKAVSTPPSEPAPTSDRAKPVTGGSLMDFDDGDEDERTVVGIVPRELLADSAKGGSAGLGQLLNRNDSAPTPPAGVPAADDGLVSALTAGATPAAPLATEVELSDLEDEEPSVVTSAPELLAARTAARKGSSLTAARLAATPKSNPDSFDPFADLRDPSAEGPISSTPPPIPPEPGDAHRDTPRATPKAKVRTAGEDDGEDVELEPISLQPGAPAAPPPVPKMAPPPPPTGTQPVDDAELEDIDDDLVEPAAGDSAESEAGPALLAPEHREYSADEATSIFRSGTKGPESIPPAQTSTGEIDLLAVSEDSSPGEMAAPPPPRAMAPTRPQSLAPPPLPVIPDAAWPDERNALSHLSESQLVDSFRESSTWLLEELRLQEGGEDTTHGILVVSELCAMTGDEEQAQSLAEEALSAPGAVGALAARQCRSRALVERDYGAVSQSLEGEIRAAATTATKLHAQWLLSEINRLVDGDHDRAGKRADQAMRTAQEDWRPHLVRLARELAKPSGALKLRLPESESLEPLRQAAETLNSERLPVTAKTPQPEDSALLVAYLQAALARKDWQVFAAGCSALDGIRGLGPAARWLGASLALANGELRDEVTKLLTPGLVGSLASEAERVSAAAALEQGNSEGLTEALAQATSFSPTERLALFALTGAEPGVLAAARQALGAEEPVAALGRAVAAADQNADPRDPLFVGRQWLTAAEAPVDLLPSEDGEQQESSRALRHVRSLLAAGQTGPAALAQPIAQWPRDMDADAGFERDKGVLAGIANELGGEPEAAVAHYATAAEMDPGNEPLARLKLTSGTSASAETLMELAERAESSSARGLLLLEAALRLGNEDSGFGTLLEGAHEAAPDLPFAAELALQQGRRTGDGASVLAWLRRRREVADDDGEVAADQAREALLLPDEEASAARDLIEQAAGSRPNDVALRALLERFSDEPLADQVAWLSLRVEEADSAEKPRLALQAAIAAEAQGDAESAARFAAQAKELGGSELGNAMAERVGLSGEAAADLASSLMARAKELEDGPELRETYRRLAIVDEVGRGDATSGMLWQRSILESDPADMRALRYLEQSLISSARDDDLEWVYGQPANLLPPPESHAHAQVAARLRLREGTWESTFDLVRLATKGEAPSLWGQRQMLAHRHGATAEETQAALNHLLGLSERPSEKSELASRLADLAETAGDGEQATALRAQAYEQTPEYLPALLGVAPARSGAEAGEIWQKAAELSEVSAHQARFYHAAGLAFWDANERERAVASYEAVVERDLGYEDVFAKLQEVYSEERDGPKLAELLERRLEIVEDPEERVALEVSRARALLDIGETYAAKTALEGALEHNPEHPEALSAFADLCLAEEDWEGAERALIRLERLTADPKDQAEIFLRLGTIYVDFRDNPERAQLALQQVLKRDPEHVVAKRKLVEVLCKIGDEKQALSLQQQLVKSAPSREERRLRSIELADLYENAMGDVRKAEQTLEALRRSSPHDARVLRALADFHSKQGNQSALDTLLDRAASDARRALGTGRFDPNFFANLATVSDLRGDMAAAEVAKCAQAALQAKPAEVPGLGPEAVGPDIDAQLAPAIFTPAFQQLLRHIGQPFAAITAPDMAKLRATEMPASGAAIEAQIQDVAARMGVSGLQVLVSPAVGSVCVPISLEPAVLVFGAALVAEPQQELREFLTVRALKLLQAGLVGFSRLAPIELWPTLAAALKTLAPDYKPKTVDARRFAAAQKKWAGHLPAPGGAASQLAMEVGNALGSRTSTLQAAANSWGNRAAFAAFGNLSKGLEAISWASGHPKPLPTAEKARSQWISRNAEARDLLVFSVSDEFINMRR